MVVITGTLPKELRSGHARTVEKDEIVSKATVTRVFWGSLVAVIAGAVLVFAAVWVAYANGAFVMDGPDVVGVQSTPAAWAVIGLGIVAALAIIAGLIGGLVSWIGALLNTAQLEDKTWFIVLLVLGLVSFGLVAMIAYVIAGPDGTRHSTPGTMPATV
jgi:H+/Cl- antiporter ClcA